MKYYLFFALGVVLFIVFGALFFATGAELFKGSGIWPLQVVLLPIYGSIALAGFCLMRERVSRK